MSQTLFSSKTTTWFVLLLLNNNDYDYSLVGKISLIHVIETDQQISHNYKPSDYSFWLEFIHFYTSLLSSFWINWTIDIEKIVNKIFLKKELLCNLQAILLKTYEPQKPPN